MTKLIPNLTVPVLNRYDLLNRMLSSIDFPVRDLLIIDNGGELANLAKPKLVENLHVLPMPSNFGVAASWNLGIKSFRHDPIWFFASNDMTFAPGAMQQLFESALSHRLTLTEMFPHFHAFALGESVVKVVGLFDENLYPAFEEDIEYLGRMERAGLPVVKVPIQTHHDNSSTIHSETRYRDANTVTHPSNSDYRRRKESGVIPLTETMWELSRWRRQDWR